MPIKKRRFAVQKVGQKVQGARVSIVKKSISASNLVEYFRDQGRMVKQNPQKQFVFFVLGFLLSYLVLTFLVGLIPDIYFKEATGRAVQGILSIQGVTTNTLGAGVCSEFSWISDSLAGTCYSFGINANSLMGSTITQAKTIVISWLCTGILEIIILISAIIASFGVNWKKKLVGIGIAIIAGVVFNLLRIWVTINIILSQDVGTIELAHDVLFRFVLFVYIVVIYVAWFYWAARDKER